MTSFKFTAHFMLLILVAVLGAQVISNSKKRVKIQLQ